MADVPPEVRAFAADIREILRDDTASLSIRETAGEAGSESGVTLLVRGVPLFHFRRDEFIEAVHSAGCDAMADLGRAGLPLVVDRSTGGRPCLRACLGLPGRPCGVAYQGQGSRCDAHRRQFERERRPSFDQRYGGRAWRRLSTAARQAQPWCGRCGTTTDLTVDHVRPHSLAEGLRVLCRKCHGEIGRQGTRGEGVPRV